MRKIKFLPIKIHIAQRLKERREALSIKILEEKQ